MSSKSNPLTTLLHRTNNTLSYVLENTSYELRYEEVGTVATVGNGIAQVDGLPGAAAQELLYFPHGVQGMAFMLRPKTIGAILLGNAEHLQAGDPVYRSHRVLDVPVGDALLGRILTPLGEPRDDGPPISTSRRRAVEQPAPPIMARAPVSQPLQTGLKAVDALIPIGRGQRELILGDRQTGKTAVALDTILHQQPGDVICIYCAIGQRDDAVAKLIDVLRRENALAYTIVLIATGADAPGLQYIAPYAATSIGEAFMAEGRDVLVVYDDLTQHARAYRELSLLLRRAPGREAYPGDIFYIHSRLLERATHLREEEGGGSLTALPILETQAQNLSAYIPTNLISITDGQIYLSPDLFQKGVLPAIDVGRSVSRVGGKAQLDAYQAVAGDLRLSYSQFEELESFARFGTRLDEETRRTLRRGRRVREILQQPQYDTIPVAEQIAVLVATTAGVFDRLPENRVREAAKRLRRAFREQLAELYERINQGHPLRDEEHEEIVDLAEHRIGQMYEDTDKEERS